MQKDKYIHTEKDKEDDILLIKEFTKIFEDKFKSTLNLSIYNLGELDGIEEYQYCIPDSSFGAQTIYAMHDGEGSEMIWLSTGINPNGITENIIARTFDIKYQKRINEQVVQKFYDYSMNSNEVIKKFELFFEEIKIVEGK